MNKQIQAIFDKQMGRREFLGYIGATVMATIGISGMIKALLSHSGQQMGTTSTVRHQDQGYGSTPYGGLTQSRH